MFPYLQAQVNGFGYIWILIHRTDYIHNHKDISVSFFHQITVQPFKCLPHGKLGFTDPIGESQCVHASGTISTFKGMTFFEGKIARLANIGVTKNYIS